MKGGIMAIRFLLRAAMITGVMATCGVAAAAELASAIEGGWDLTIHDGASRLPSWLGVKIKDGRLEGSFVGTGGGVSSVEDLKFEDGKLQFRRGNEQYEAKLADGELVGEVARKNGAKLKFVGKRFVPRPQTAAPEWGEPIKLFNGKDLDGWEGIRGEKGTGNWKAEDGELVNPAHGANIRTKAVFRDFKLHIEFNVPPHGNSGVYLRGRYEIQVADSFGEPPGVGSCGALYGRIAPSENVCKKAGEWQSFDITIVGQRLTVVQNGKTIIDNKVIEGITGGAIDSDEYAPGPIYLQGDHTAVKYRNIVLTPAKTSTKEAVPEKAKARKAGAKKAKAAAKEQ